MEIVMFETEEVMAASTTTKATTSEDVGGSEDF